jgi:plasmid stability protein
MSRESAINDSIRSIEGNFVTRHSSVANLIVRNVEENVVRALKLRAGKHGRSAEAEHRLILVEALLGSKKKSFIEALLAMPDVGRDEDFARVQEPPRAEGRKGRRVPR